MRPVSDVVDLCDRSGRHANAKVMAFITTMIVSAIVVLIVILDRTVSWPLAAVLGGILLAPYGLDGWKVLLKLRHGARVSQPGG